MKDMNHDIHLIKDSKACVLYHIPSSQYFDISEDIYNRVKGYLQGENTSDTKVQEIMEYLSGQEETRKKSRKKGSNPRQLGKVVFLATQSCNLACKYCFAGQGCYNETDEMKMPLEIYKDTIDYLLKKYPEGVKQIEFFGGEPLLGFKEIQEFIPFCAQEFTKKGLKPPMFGVVTNGTVFTEEMIDLFNEYSMPITISVDGPKAVNDKVRISRGGWSVFDKIAENLSWINQRRKFPLFFEVTLNKQHVDAYSPGVARGWMEELCALGFDAGVVGVVEAEAEELNLSPNYEENYKKLYGEIADYWFETLMSDKAFCTFDFFRTLEMITKNRELPACGAGYDSITVTAKGEILPCYLFYGDARYDMGSVHQENSEAFRKMEELFLSSTEYRPQECRECWLRSVCSVWCRGFSNSKFGNMSGICKPRCWTAEAMTERVMLNTAIMQRDEKEYRRFLDKLREFNGKFVGVGKIE